MNNQKAIHMAKNLKADQNYNISYRKLSVAKLALMLKKASKSSLVIEHDNNYQFNNYYSWSRQLKTGGIIFHHIEGKKKMVVSDKAQQQRLTCNSQAILSNYSFI